MVKLFPADARTEFVDLVCAGMSLIGAARRVGASDGTARRWWAQCGQMSVNLSPQGGLADPAPSAEGPNERALSQSERGMIQMGRRNGMSYAEIGKAIGRNKSVVWREVKRHTSGDGAYYASVAHVKAHQSRRRPKQFKLIENEDLCRLIAVWMDDGWSPKLISSMLAFYFADDQTGRVKQSV